MDLVWNNLLTCDYERTRPGAPRVELDLYTRSLTSWPRILLGDPRPYGHLRRPGIVDIPQADHEALTSVRHQRRRLHGGLRRAPDLTELENASTSEAGGKPALRIADEVVVQCPEGVPPFRHGTGTGG